MIFKRLAALWRFSASLVARIEDEATAHRIDNYQSELTEVKHYSLPTGMAKIVDMSGLDDFGEEEQMV